MINILKPRYFWHTSPLVFNFWYTVFTILAFNSAFIVTVYKINSLWLSAALITIVTFCAFNVIFNILSFPRLVKPLAIILCLCNSVALYFMNAYGVVIDKVMFLNILQTDIYEVRDLLNIKMLSYFLLFGILPSYLIYKTEIIFAPFKKEVRTRLLGSLGYTAVAAAVIGGFFPQAENILRQFRFLKNSLIPVNYIGAVISVSKSKLAHQRYDLQKISEDAYLLPAKEGEKPNLLIVVIGESARAANFSLQGYRRPTNEPLQRHAEKLVYFSDFTSCGTSTAISLPCIFSAAGRDEFVAESERYTENVLDIIQHAGYKLVWRENNTDCKDNCNRIELEKFCQVKECPDEILLTDLEKKARSTDKHTLMVLHQRGSHGPLYRLRYPQAFNKYMPICQGEYLQDCRKEDLINAYDNSIYYTSYMLAQTLDRLEALSQEYNTAFLFVSDHGESLGEDNVYLHSAPYKTAPEYQTHIPMMLWFSDAYAKANNIDTDCVKNLRHQAFSHDNIFHTLLGMSNVASKYYRRELDILASCRH